MKKWPMSFCYSSIQYLHNDLTFWHESIGPCLKKISVVIRTEGKRIAEFERALDSLASQTFQNFDVIAVENGGHALNLILQVWKERNPTILANYVSKKKHKENKHLFLKVDKYLRH